MRRLHFTIVAFSLLGLPVVRAAEPETPVAVPSAEETVQVTATRYAEDPANLPTVVTVLDGQLLRDRGITDLRSALGVVAGVDIAPGGDGGPASAVPEMWGLREFDAFLLVVDGVPWGGAFNPDLASLSLRDVARIEILRGSAPVMYGATSFIGVIQVVHNAPGAGVEQVGVTAGTNSSGGASAAIDLPVYAGVSSRISVDAMKQGYADDRTSWKRGHVLWRNRIPAGGGDVRLDLDLLWLNQDPASPSPRVGTTLSPDFDADSNVNPLGSHIDPRRGTLSAGYDHATGFGSWAVTASYAYATLDVLRGFLIEDPVFPLTNANGFRQKVAQDEVYLDGHLAFNTVPNVEIIAGIDTMYGRGRAHGGDFDYTVSPDGSNAPDGDAIPSAADVSISDKRLFGGIYGYAAWTPNWRFRVDAGARVNLTSEDRDTAALEFGGPPVFSEGSDSRNETKVSGSAGVTFTVWRHGADDAKVFAGYRNTYKPAAIDFGLDAEPTILEPETGVSYEVGARTALLDRRLELELEAFSMDLEGIVVAGGTGGLQNGGDQRLRGVDLEARGRVADRLWMRFAWSFHGARFLDFVQDFGGVPTQLKGKRVEMSARNMGAFGAIWAPSSGVTGHAEVRYTGSRYLNKRNTALAPGFTSYSAGIGWRAKRFEVRLDGENLSDRRDPVSEAELADAQYYRLPARQVWLSFNWLF